MVFEKAEKVLSSESKQSQKARAGKLTGNEEMKEGRVDSAVFKEYFRTFGWQSGVIIFGINLFRYAKCYNWLCFRIQNVISDMPFGWEKISGLQIGPTTLIVSIQL